MRTRKTNSASKPVAKEFIPVEPQRITAEEFDMWDDEPCLASAD
jgi:hypothetical protein